MTQDTRQRDADAAEKVFGFRLEDRGDGTKAWFGVHPSMGAPHRAHASVRWVMASADVPSFGLWQAA